MTPILEPIYTLFYDYSYHLIAFPVIIAALWPGAFKVRCLRATVTFCAAILVVLTVSSGSKILLSSEAAKKTTERLSREGYISSDR